MNPLEPSDIDLIVEALNHYKHRVQSTDYPTYQFRQEQLNRIDETLDRLLALADEI